MRAAHPTVNAHNSADVVSYYSEHMTPEEPEQESRAGAICAATWPADQSIRCSHILGHEGQHQAEKPGEGGTSSLLFDLVYWDDE
jgi:hypothetical protein